MTNTFINYEVENELNNARTARANGNEGKARVCARRAAGLALRNYFKKQDLPEEGLSAYQLLKAFLNLSGIPPKAKQNAINLTLRVTESFNLPDHVDLITEARSLCEQLVKM